jgi:hypothetical protein
MYETLYFIPVQNVGVPAFSTAIGFINSYPSAARRKTDWVLETDFMKPSYRFLPSLKTLCIGKSALNFEFSCQGVSLRTCHP